MQALLFSQLWYNPNPHANVAQSVEQTLRKRPVGGSIPFVGLKKRLFSQSLFLSLYT